MNRLLIFVSFYFLPIFASAQENTQEFEFSYENVTLNGVLNMPLIKSPKGIVLIVHGSGRTNAVTQNLYGDVRTTLTDAGYATFMWDKMGCGKSGGSFDYNQTVESSASEVVAAIEALKRSKIPGSNDVGLWGISRAGWVSPLVISQYEDIKFWISVSGVDDKESFNYLFENNLRISGYSEDSIKLLLQELKSGVRISHGGGSFEDYLSGTQHLRENAFLSRFNNGSQVTEKGYYDYQKDFMKQELDSVSGLIKYVADFDSILLQIKCPVLALFGEKDMHVDWQKTKVLYERTLAESTALTIASFPGCNHNMFKAKTGGFYEFEDDKLPWDRCDGFLETMSKWLGEME